MHVVLAVGDLPRSLAFYEGAFGWPRNGAIDFENYVELLKPGGGVLGLFEREGFAGEAGADPMPADPARETATEIYVRLDDARSAVERLRALGARQLKQLERKVWGDEAAYFADPDGNVVAVAQFLHE